MGPGGEACFFRCVRRGRGWDGGEGGGGLRGGRRFRGCRSADQH